MPRGLRKRNSKNDPFHVRHFNLHDWGWLPCINILSVICGENQIRFEERAFEIPPLAVPINRKNN